MISPRPWIEHLARHVPLAREGTDPEGVHQLRVAAGRLSVWLELARRRTLRDDLRWLRRSAAPVRDLDVLLHRHGKQSWAEALHSERARHAAELVAALDTPRCTGLVRALQALPEIDERVAVKSLGRLHSRMQRAGARAIGGELDAGALHTLRKRVRRYRYALEWLVRDSSAVKELQEELGELNDRAVALARARATGVGAQDVQHQLVREIEAGYARTRELWKAFSNAKSDD